jgi:TRAP-type uncharacterized transport system fused permease subunit
MDRAALANQIVEAFASMPVQLQVAARYVLDHPDDVALLSMREQARQADVQPATMTRLAQKLGFSGYDRIKEIHAHAIRTSSLGFAGKAGAQVATQKIKGKRALAGEMLASLSQQIARLGEGISLSGLVEAAMFLLWCLMFEGMSPALSVFWATTTTIGILLTQRPLVALFRGGRNIAVAIRQSAWDLVDGLNLGARNMMGIAVATATAGIVVGTMTLTGMSQRMTDLVEVISGGNVIFMLLLTASICLIIGLGIPTTASYILFASLMVPVIVELGAQAGVAIPLIAVHLFVFYFGIMADVTPPVGLAAFAAAAISGEDPNKIGW